MPIRFESDPREPTFPVLQFPPGEPILIVVGSDRAHERQHLLHWLPQHARSVPCTHEDCPWCPSPRRSVTYIPALQIAHGRWAQRILPLNDGMLPFLKENRELVVWEFKRGPRNNAPVRWKPVIAFGLKIPTFVGFDVVPSLLRMWGEFKELRRIARPASEGEVA